jgi:hypothetical protein
LLRLNLKQYLFASHTVFFYVAEIWSDLEASPASLGNHLEH